MQPEEAVEVRHHALATRACDRDCRARVVVRRLSVRHHHVEAIYRAAQKDRYQPITTAAGRQRSGCPRTRTQQDYS